MTAPPARIPLPVTVLTGFLGSGKTTLLSRLLRHPDMGRTAVIVNEFGEVGLDHDLLESSDEDIVELDSGCLCCSVRGDLVRTIADLIVRREGGVLPRFERILIETTGLADPAPILHALIADPVLAECVALDGIVTTVDAATGTATLDTHVEAVRQAAVADRLLLTKTDLVAPEAVAVLTTRLAALNPAAAPITVSFGDVAPDRLFGAGLFDLAGKIPDVAAWLRAEAYREGGGHPHDHGQEGHAHDVLDPNRHDDRIRAFCVLRERPIPAVAFTLFLEALADNCGPNLLRVKGILNIAESPDRPGVIHGVQHVFHPPAWLDAWPSADRRSRLVFIGRDIPQTWVETLLELLDEEVRERQALR